ncbi:hypothetical protein BLNAU_5519 [Blattamonas nauphoetae]|uniref:Uncharacterized protein n=1 Tax=Blattamonas nauphoetae TaxID=2049346 RepID=A0ABQ9Y6R9_9EUKA|nr:hypothetical protein BLNAU_5519 [Blattamonas nauphoetae]
MKETKCQPDEDNLTTLSNVVFTIEQTNSFQSIPLSETLFTHLAHLLDSQHPQIRSLTLRLISELVSSPPHKSLLLKHTLRAINTSATEMPSEAVTFLRFVFDEKSFLNSPTSEFPPSLDKMKVVFAPYMPPGQSQYILKLLKDSEFVSRRINKELLAAKSHKSDNQTPFSPQLDSLLTADSPFRAYLKELTRKNLPILNMMNAQPSYFKLIGDDLMPPPLRFQQFHAILSAAVFHRTDLPQCLMTNTERYVYECLPPLKAITGWLRNGYSLKIGTMEEQITHLFTFDEWRELVLFLSRRSFDQQLENFDRDNPITLDMHAFLLTTFALPATFSNPVCQLIAPLIWKNCSLDSHPLDTLVDCVSNRSKHPLIILAICRSLLSQEDLLALLGSELVLPLLCISFGSFLPVVRTAALMFMRRVVDFRSIELNISLLSLSVFELVLRTVEGSSFLDDYANGTHILSELLSTVEVLKDSRRSLL